MRKTLKKSKKSKKSKTRRGGGIIGKGSRGCVFQPALPCKGTGRVEGVVSKLHTINSKNNKKKLSELLDFLNAIDPNQEFFLYELGTCIPDVNKFNNTNQVNQCIGESYYGHYTIFNMNLAKSKPGYRNLFKLSLMKYGGISLKDLAINGGLGGLK